MTVAVGKRDRAQLQIQQGQVGMYSWGTEWGQRMEMTVRGDIKGKEILAKLI